MTADDKAQELGVDLKAFTPPGNLAPATRVGNTIYTSGYTSVGIKGKLGQDLTVEQGYEAAKLTLLNALAIAKQELGSLDRITRVVRMSGHVASAEGFTQQPAVLNGASDLLVQIFGEAGRHARLALGAAELPLNMAIELELILQVM